MAEPLVKEPNVKERPAQWPSPWPYDFPVEGKVRSGTDKGARAAGVEPAAPGRRTTRRSLSGPACLGWGALAAAGGIGTIGLVRFRCPSVNFEPPQKLRTA